jgi:short subunit dehydrogenase-like uncharacterized protein
MEMTKMQTAAREQAPWMIYGAYGFTGRLVVAEAVRRGHRPVISGRDRAQLDRLAAEFRLLTLPLSLDDPQALTAALRGHRLVINAAGPFVETAPPLVRACLEARTGYVDISGEIHHIRWVTSQDSMAKGAGIAVLTGAGFGVTFGECLAHYVLARVPDATHLRLSVAADNVQTTPAVRRTILDVLARGGFALERHRWTRRSLAHQIWTVAAGSGTLAFAAAPMGELAALSRSTEVPNIVVGRPMPPGTAAQIRRLSPLIKLALSIGPLRRALGRTRARPVKAPEPAGVRRSRIWAEAHNGRGAHALAQLETGEGYAASAEAALANVEALFEDSKSGAFTPALAFGAHLLKALPGATVTDLAAGACLPRDAIV